MSACRIHVRGDQYASQAPMAQTREVRIYASDWVEKALKKLGKKLDGVKFEVRAKSSPTASDSVILESFTVEEELTLRQLQMIARNEPRNTSGVITSAYYDYDICEDDLILALKDLVRQTVIVGLDETVAYGGFPKGVVERVPQVVPVYICDLSALQFQQSSNSGRLVLYRQRGREIGFLDDYIFEKVVGEPRKRYREVQRDTSERYVRVSGVEDIYFDTYAYRKFIVQDVVLCGKALDKLATKHRQKLHFKFLNYGTGHFAGKYGPILRKHILPAVVKGLKLLFKKNDVSSIKSVEFPFYEKNAEAIEALDRIQEKYKVKYMFTKEDALKMTSPHPDYIIATTNCGNPHSPIGNATTFGSIDGAIANNLKSRGNIFCPSLNKKMKSKFLDLEL